MLWRQGDVLIEAVAEIPADAHQMHSTVLAYGEATGHAHRVESQESAELWVVNGQIYIKVTDATHLIHDEHLPIALAPGLYHVWQQREYTPEAIRRVRD